LTATDEDMLPFASVGRSGWGGPKEVRRVATLAGRVLQGGSIVKGNVVGAMSGFCTIMGKWTR